MFSNWFSGDDLEIYRTSPHKQRIDAIANSLLRLQYASEVIRQHLHEWLRFSLTLDARQATPLPAPNAEAVRQYVAERVAGCSATCRYAQFAVNRTNMAVDGMDGNRQFLGDLGTSQPLGQKTQYLSFPPG